jgi:hypothetical protein
MQSGVYTAFVYAEKQAKILFQLILKKTLFRLKK